MNGPDDEYREHAAAVVAFLVLLLIGVLMFRVGHQIAGSFMVALGFVMLAESFSLSVSANLLSPSANAHSPFD
jgi:hypothetical protein